MGQADFGKLELKNIRKDSGNSQCLSVVNMINLKHDQLELNMTECSDLRLSWTDKGTTILGHFKAFFYANIQTNKHSIVGAENVGMPA